MDKPKLWELVKSVEEARDNNLSELQQCKATMIVNYGADGRNTPDLIHPDWSLLKMLVVVLEHYEKQLKEQTNER